MSTLTFMNILGKDCYLKKINLQKSGFSTKYTQVNLESIDTTKLGAFDIKSEMEQSIEFYDVFLATTNFEELSVVTSSGIITVCQHAIMDRIYDNFYASAFRKKKDREEELDQIFSTSSLSYSEAVSTLYRKNEKIIEELLLLHKYFLSQPVDIEIDTYQKLLKYLISMVEPVMLEKYNEPIKQFLKEYPIK